MYSVFSVDCDEPIKIIDLAILVLIYLHLLIHPR